MVQKSQPQGVIWVPSSPPHAGHFSEIFWQHNCPVVKIVYGQLHIVTCNKIYTYQHSVVIGHRQAAADSNYRWPRTLKFLEKVECNMFKFWIRWLVYNSGVTPLEFWGLRIKTFFFKKYHFFNEIIGFNV